MAPDRGPTDQQGTLGLGFRVQGLGSLGFKV